MVSFSQTQELVSTFLGEGLRIRLRTFQPDGHHPPSIIHHPVTGNPPVGICFSVTDDSA
jgi:hypothetical protein